MGVINVHGSSDLYRYADDSALRDAALLDVQREMEDGRAMSAPPVTDVGGGAPALVAPQNEQYLPPAPGDAAPPVMSFEDFGRRAIPGNPRMITRQMYDQVKEGYDRYLGAEQLRQQGGRNRQQGFRDRAGAAVDVSNAQSRQGEIAGRNRDRDYRDRQAAVANDIKTRFKTLEAAAVADIIAGNDSDVVKMWKKIKGVLPDGVLTDEANDNKIKAAALKEIKSGEPGPAVDAYLLTTNQGAYVGNEKRKAGTGSGSQVGKARMEEDLFGTQRSEPLAGEGLPDGLGIAGRLASKKATESTLGWVELYQYLRDRGPFMTGVEGEQQRAAVNALLEKHKPKVDDVVALGPRSFSDPSLGGNGTWVGMKSPLLTKRQVLEILQAIMSPEDIEKRTQAARKARARQPKPAEIGEELEPKKPRERFKIKGGNRSYFDNFAEPIHERSRPKIISTK